MGACIIRGLRKQGTGIFPRPEMGAPGDQVKRVERSPAHVL